MDLLSQLKTLITGAKVPYRTIALKRNEFLKVKGSVDTHLYLINEGTLRIFIEDGSEEHTIRLGYSGNFIAALDSFISDQPSELYIQALKKSNVSAYKKSDYKAFLNSSEEASTLWQTMNEWLIYQQLEREKDILTQSPKTRYERVLNRSPRLFQEIPLKYIASYLRMTPETLSRLRNS